MAQSIECPNCGAPADDLPADPNATVSCSYCGSTFERVGAEQALASLKSEISAWLQKTAGVSGKDGADAIDATTRSFIFNDRLLRGLRRDVRGAIDEAIGDVQGSPVFIANVLRQFRGFRDDEAVLLSRRAAVLALRPLRARLQSSEVTAFATSAADQMALNALVLEIDRTMLASNAANALSAGATQGRQMALTNLAELGSKSESTTIEEATDPSGSALAHAMHGRCASLARTLEECGKEQVSPDAIAAAADDLDKLAHWMIANDVRGLRSALASTGVHRDATALRMVGKVSQALSNTGIHPLSALDGMAPLAGLLSTVRRSVDVAFLVGTWANVVAGLSGKRGLPIVTDTTWGHAAISMNLQTGEQVAHQEGALTPFMSFHVRHAKTEGLFLVSGRQYEGYALVPLSAHETGTMFLEPGDPALGAIECAQGQPSQPQMLVDAAFVGPDEARRRVTAALRQRGLKNVTVGDGTITYMPVMMVRYAGPRGERLATLGPRGELPHEPRHVQQRAQTLAQVARAVG